MTKKEKKELFLLILENCFLDKTGEINNNNCISFYHFFIEYLYFEARFNSHELSGLKDFITSVIEIFYNLESYKDKFIFNQENFLVTIHSISGAISQQNIDTCMSEVQTMYSLAKEEFFI